MNSKLKTVALAGALSLFASFPALADNCPSDPNAPPGPPQCHADVPEPGSLPLFLAGAAAVAFAARRKKK